MGRKKTKPEESKEAKIDGPERPQPQAFSMIRNGDETGISGTGVVAHGIVFPSGSCVVEWCTATPCIHIWHSFEAFKAVHIDSHPDNNTEILWHRKH